MSELMTYIGATQALRNASCDAFLAVAEVTPMISDSY